MQCPKLLFDPSCLFHPSLSFFYLDQIQISAADFNFLRLDLILAFFFLDRLLSQLHDLVDPEKAETI